MANQNFRVKNGINVGTAVTITTGEFQVGDTRIHTSGIEAKSINVSSGVVTATSIVATTGTFTGNVSIGGTLTYEDVTNIDSIGIVTARSGVRINSGGLVVTSGVSTLGNTIVGGATTQLIVDGDARITGILTIGTSSITLDGTNNQVNVGTGVTIHTTNGFQIGSNTLHSTGLTVNSLSASGVITATTFRGNLTGNVTGAVNSSGIATFSNGIIVSAGSASAPSISPTGDSNTGIFFPSPDTIAFTEGGVEALRVDSSSNIGIGTTGTGDKLTVLGRVQIQQDSGSNNRLILRGQPGSTYRWNIDNNGSSNDLRIFREDDATAAGGLVYASLSSSGNLTLNNGNLVIGTAGKGIDFSATANSSGTMTSELLSDYEEGTWTPSITGHTLSASSSGKYTKIGRTVHFWAQIIFGGSGAATATVNGLPFTVANDGWGGYVAIQDTGITTPIHTFSHGGISQIMIRNTSNVDYNTNVFYNKFIYIQGAYYVS